jgi:hypothetical protein
VIWGVHISAPSIYNPTSQAISWLDHSESMRYIAPAPDREGQGTAPGLQQGSNFYVYNPAVKGGRRRRATHVVVGVGVGVPVGV